LIFRFLTDGSATGSGAVGRRLLPVRSPSSIGSLVNGGGSTISTTTGGDGVAETGGNCSSGSDSSLSLLDEDEEDDDDDEDEDIGEAGDTGGEGLLTFGSDSDEESSLDSTTALLRSTFFVRFVTFSLVRDRLRILSSSSSSSLAEIFTRKFSSSSSLAVDFSWHDFLMNILAIVSDLAATNSRGESSSDDDDDEDMVVGWPANRLSSAPGNPSLSPDEERRERVPSRRSLAATFSLCVEGEKFA
jgi:hypothetical protein